MQVCGRTTTLDRPLEAFPGGNDADDLAQMLLSAQEDERRKIAADLHDGIGQCLSAVQFAMGGLGQQIRDRLTAAEADKYDRLLRTVARSIEEVRRLSMDLRPPMLDDLGVVSAIDWFCAETRQLFPQIDVVQELSADENAIADPAKIAIFRIVQEACNNACKHSGGKRLRVFLETDAETVWLEVADDGVGFDPASMRRAFAGSGLGSMRQRASLTNGRLVVRSRPGAGTRIIAAWSAVD